MIAWIFSLLVVASWAGNEVGNGGNVVVCTDQSVRLLDYYEAEELLDFELSLDGETEIEIVAAVLERMKRLDAERAANYAEKLAAFFDNVRFLDKALLPDTQDYGEVELPTGCRIEQLCIQKEPALPEFKRYAIHRPLWDRLSVRHRAGLILHEIVYGEAIAKGHKDSRKSRYVTGMLSATAMNTFTQAQYDERIEKAGFGAGGLPSFGWIAQPLVLPAAHAGSLYSVSLARYVQGGHDMRFSKVAGPAWALVYPDGTMQGLAGLFVEGKNEFVVKVSDSTGIYALGTLVVNVE